MFKAINTIVNGAVIILDEEWDDENTLDQLRSLGLDGHLICQGCRMPVRVRAGQLRRRHFAHWNLADCLLAQESEELLATRAALYKRLRREFGDRVTLEYKPTGDAVQGALDRPIDCWIAGDGPNGAIVYWVFDRQMRKRNEREALRALLKNVGASHYYFLFVATMRRAAEERYGEALILSTTERELLANSAYDITLDGAFLAQHQSLQYIDHAAEHLLSYRGLKRVHGDQMYQSPYCDKSGRAKNFARPLLTSLQC